MQVGVGLPNTLSGADRELMLNWARQADAGPFSSLGLFDRLLYDSYEPLTTIAAAAAVTQRIRLATTILIAPLHNTVLLAKSAATIDALANGRFTLGVAVGARESDYTAAGVPYQERGKRLERQLADLRRYWEDESFGPQPVQPNGPELLVGGLTDAIYARVARYADGYVHNGGPPRAFARSAEKALAAWRDAGRAGRASGAWATSLSAATRRRRAAATCATTTTLPAPSPNASPRACSPRRRPWPSSFAATPTPAATSWSSFRRWPISGSWSGWRRWCRVGEVARLRGCELRVVSRTAAAGLPNRCGRSPDRAALPDRVRMQVRSGLPNGCGRSPDRAALPDRVRMQVRSGLLNGCGRSPDRAALLRIVRYWAG
jgi:alkanesulfonate monooxygenase SsuD/methylene tetrahydromethanopterin reductase-like flavin-dependent oxidoreductase (luciferase family)